MGNKSNSFLSLQSKEWLVKALQILMKTKNYSDITIKELAQKAGVDRKTFYRNFKSKEDVLRFYLDRTCQDYIARLNKENKLTTFSIAKAFFSTCKQHTDFLILLDKNDLLPLLLIAFDDYLPMLHEMFEDKRIDDNPVYYSEYALSFLTGGFWNISIKWIRRGGHETPEEIYELDEAGLCKRLYKVTGMSSMVVNGCNYGTLSLLFHQEARSAKDVKLTNGVFKNTETTRAAIALYHTQFKAFVQGYDFEMDDLISTLKNFPNIIIVDNPEKNEYPMPINATGHDEVFVGRIRRDESVKSGVNLWVVADNIRKGAASNAVQILEKLISE